MGEHYAEQGGEGGDLLLLVHGLGATAGVWNAMLADNRWSGRWLAPDLPGHGGSLGQAAYGIADYVEALSSVLAEAGPISSLTILGHSLGGVIAAALATRDDVRAVYGLGIKLDWTDEEVARMATLAQREPRLFEDRETALGQHAKQCGLAGVPPSSPLLARGVVDTDGGWRASVDMAAFEVARPDLAGAIAAAHCPIHLAAGETDAMVTIERLRDFDPGARLVAGAGHNAMVDAPGAVWDWILG
jgi:pimeloyl-ACP methyl ester carboxylesterase